MIRTLAFLVPYFRRYRRRLVVGLLAVLISVAIGLAAPLIIGRAVDALREDLTRSALLYYAGLLLAVALAQGVFTYLRRMILITLSRNIENDLRDRYFRQLTRLSQRFFHDHATGDLMARATNDLEAVRQLCGPAIMYGGNTVFTVAGALYFMLRIHPTLTLVVLANLPLVALATKIVGARIHVLFQGVQESFSELTAKVQENLAGVRVVRAYAQEEGQEKVFEQANRDYVEHNRRLIRWNAAFSPLLQMLVGLGFVAVLWYGGLLVVRGALTLGEFVTFTFFLGRMIWPMIAVGWVINLAQRGAASLGRIRQVIEEEPEIADREPLTDPGPLSGALAFCGLDFAYPGGPEVLRGIEVEVPAGTTVALVGRTGAGKSTLLSMVPRVIEPPEGSVFADGVDVRRLPLERLRGAIAAVPQESFLFSATLRDNIAFGRPDADAEEVTRAAELAGLGDDLASFPQGLDTMVGERGLTLSGGQKQRVALARALLCEPRILLLDDCLSAVDTRTEERILRNLRQVFAGRTVLLVAHRISTVQGADLILVLDEGRVVERGSHDDLLALGGHYADLHRRQMLEEELAAV